MEFEKQDRGLTDLKSEIARLFPESLVNDSPSNISDTSSYNGNSTIDNTPTSNDSDKDKTSPMATNDPYDIFCYAAPKTPIKYTHFGEDLKEYETAANHFLQDSWSPGSRRPRNDTSDTIDENFLAEDNYISILKNKISSTPISSPPNMKTLIPHPEDQDITMYSQGKDININNDIPRGDNTLLYSKNNYVLDRTTNPNDRQNFEFFPSAQNVNVYIDSCVNELENVSPSLDTENMYHDMSTNFEKYPNNYRPFNPNMQSRNLPLSPDIIEEKIYMNFLIMKRGQGNNTKAQFQNSSADFKGWLGDDLKESYENPYFPNYLIKDSLLAIDDNSLNAAQCGIPDNLFQNYQYASDYVSNKNTENARTSQSFTNVDFIKRPYGSSINAPLYANNLDQMEFQLPSQQSNRDYFPNYSSEYFNRISQMELNIREALNKSLDIAGAYKDNYNKQRLPTDLVSPSDLIAPVNANMHANLYNRIEHFIPKASVSQSKREDTPSFCTFCKKNGETSLVYTSHRLKRLVGGEYVILCPILRAHVCIECGVSGDYAHTISYCPVMRRRNKGQAPLCSTAALKNTRIKSCGKRRY